MNGKTGERKLRMLQIFKFSNLQILKCVTIKKEEI
jgi:hypothetical protein